MAGINTVTESGSMVDYLYAWHNDGTAVSGWPIRQAPGFVPTVTVIGSGFGFGAPVLADVDGDGKAEVVVSGDATADAFALHAFRGDATEVAGFPKATASTGPYPVNTPAVADFDGDGLLELVWLDQYQDSLWAYPPSKLLMWDLVGPKTGPQPWPMFHHEPQNTGLYPPSASPPDGGVGGSGSGGASSTGGRGGTGSGGAPASGGQSSTGGTGSGTNPCATHCSSPTVFTGPNYQSGTLGSGAICRETTANLSGGNCSNMSSRVLSVNGVSMSCNGWTLPAKHNGGYCVQVTAGSPDWASFATW